MNPAKFEAHLREVRDNTSHRIGPDIFGRTPGKNGFRVGAIWYLQKSLNEMFAHVSVANIQGRNEGLIDYPAVPAHFVNDSGSSRFWADVPVDRLWLPLGARDTLARLVCQGPDGEALSLPYAEAEKPPTEELLAALATGATVRIGHTGQRGIALGGIPLISTPL